MNGMAVTLLFVVNNFFRRTEPAAATTFRPTRTEHAFTYSGIKRNLQEMNNYEKTLNDFTWINTFHSVLSIYDRFMIFMLSHIHKKVAHFVMLSKHLEEQ